MSGTAHARSRNPSAHQALRRGSVLLAVCTLGTLRPGRAAAEDTTTTPYPGVTHIERVTSTQKIHVVKVDLSRATIRIRATPPGSGGKTVPAFAAAAGVQVAINGDFGTRVAPWRTSGLAMGDGEVWSNTKDSTIEGFLAFGVDNRAALSTPAEVMAPAEPWMHEIVGGRPLVVEDGVALDAVAPYSRDGCAPHFCQPEPRSALGISADGTTLILATIDGRRTGASGMTTRQVGDLMVGLGAARALNIDGGGSTTMWIQNEGGVVNVPSDGTPRVVSNHLGIQIVEPFGDLTGFVRAGAIDNEEEPVAGATVTLSTGAIATTAADGSYTFTDVPAGVVSVTAAADGFATSTIERYVAAADTTWGSIALAPPGAGGDAGVGDGDGDGVDDGDGEDVTVVGGCTAGGGGPVPSSVALVLALAALLRRSRRR